MSAHQGELHRETIITSTQAGWIDEVDKAIAVYKPDSWKSYAFAAASGRTPGAGP